MAHKQNKYAADGRLRSISPVTRKVLDALRGQGAPISKSEIVALTKLSLATVTEHVELLCAFGLLKAREFGASSGGRKPQLYGFNPGAGYVIGVDLESTHANVAITDFDLRIIDQASTDDINVTRGPQDTLTGVRDIVFDLLRAANIKPTMVMGVGLGVPGPVSFTQGLPTSLSLMPGWDSFPVRDFWKGHFDCPTFVDNNVHTMALGECADSEAESTNMIFVKIGNGIGAGIVCRGEIYRGATEHAGEIGHTNVGHDGLCYCGNRGCLEAIAGGRAIAIQAQEHARSGRSERLAAALAERGALTIRDVIRAVQESDPIAVALVRESGSAAGRALAALVNFFNPAEIVIGGSVAGAGDVLLAAIRQAVYQFALPLATRTLIIRHSKIGAQVGVLGAARLALEHALKPVEHEVEASSASLPDKRTVGLSSRAEARHG
jgi:predicted NBD/HSP70 family sugar kinase